MRVILALCLALTGAALAAEDRHVLPDTAEPVSYKIEIAPDAGTLTFAGTVEIALEVVTATDKLVLNARDIEIDSVKLSGSDATPVVTFDETREEVTFTYPASLEPGPRTLSIAYRGKIFETSSGLFVTPYTADGVKKVMLTTQFEPGDARRLAPMWDEPAAKAVFEMALVVPEALGTISNTPIVATETVEGGKKRVRFAPTPKMSSYLLYVGIGDIERIATEAEGVEIGVVTRKGDIERGRYALEISGPLLAYFNDYFGQDYPLPKLDHMAAPGAGGFGAMENWGAIFYFETSLLVDPKLTTEADRQRIYGTIAHEMAHQWFGNLVTMSWWDDLWLNEGFASWMQKKAADHFNPDWNTWLQAIRNQQDAMDLDGLASTHPIVQRVKTLDEAESAFDAITYQKGQAVITMIEGYLGEEAFRDGVRAYMAKHAFGNTVTEDLWTELQAASGTPVLDIARDFTTQPGIPMIVVDSATCRDGATHVTLHQTRFALDESANEKRTWRIPVVAATQGSSETARAVVDGMAEIAVPGCGALKLNAGHTGYFRTLYPAAGFAALKDGFAALAEADQLGLLYDSWALGAAAAQPVTDYLALTASVKPEADPLVWLQLAMTFGKIADLYRGEAGEDQFAAYARGRLKPQLDRIGWDVTASESPNVAVLRDALIETLARFGEPEVLDEAKTRFNAFVAGGTELPGGIRRAVTRAVAMQADAATWQQLVDLSAKAPTPLEQRFYFDALTFVKDPALAEKTLELSVSAAVPKQFGPRMMQETAKRHPDVAWAFVTAHQDEVNARVDEMTRYRFIPRIAAASSNPERAKELEQFFKEKLPNAPTGDMERAIGRIVTDGEVRTDRLPEINDWLGRSQ
jgi:aminopeptidase N